jgi:hypothetical protein
MAQLPELRANCPDCSVSVGQDHKDGCDVERCSACHGQRLSCDCEGHKSAASSWTGFWPGIIECHRFGWYAHYTPGIGWQTCAASHPDARADLNRWSEFVQTGKDND